VIEDRLENFERLAFCHDSTNSKGYV